MRLVPLAEAHLDDVAAPEARGRGVAREITLEQGVRRRGALVASASDQV
jgi:hypothetical protein